MSECTQKNWLTTAKRIAWKINFAWCLSTFLPGAIITSGITTCLIFIVKRNGLSVVGLVLLWCLFYCLLVGLAILSYFKNRTRFYDTRDVLIRLDDRLKLNNRLYSAYQGVGEWPGYEEYESSGLVWSPRHIVGPILMILLLMGSAIWIPFYISEETTQYSLEEPISWTEVDSWIDTLKTYEIVDKDALNKLEKQIEMLRNQPQDSWYNHSSLEGGDRLREQAKMSIEALERNLELAQNTLLTINQLQKLSLGDDNTSMLDTFTKGDKSLEEILKKSASDWKKILDNLSNSDLSVNSKLMEQLKSIDPNQLKQLSKEQLADLQKQLAEGIEGCEISLSEGLDSKDASTLLLATMGSGGVSEGPGSLPIQLNSEPTSLGSTKIESVSNKDTSKPILGDQLGYIKGEHDINPNAYNGPANAGNIKEMGKGGETVWRESLDPNEKNLLKRYFK